MSNDPQEPSSAKVAADLASLLPTSDPLAQTARLRLDELVSMDQAGRTVRQISAPSAAHPLTCLGDPLLDASAHCWLVEGIGYTNNESLIAYAASAGYTVLTVDASPEEYRNQTARLNSKGGLVRPSGGMVDGADSANVYRYPALAGDHSADVRDLIEGPS